MALPDEHARFWRGEGGRVCEGLEDGLGGAELDAEDVRCEEGDLEMQRPGRFPVDELVHYRVVRLRRAVDVLFAADLEAEDVVCRVEAVLQHRLCAHEGHVLAIAEEVGACGALCSFGGWVGLLGLVLGTLGEVEV